MKCLKFRQEVWINIRENSLVEGELFSRLNWCIVYTDPQGMIRRQTGEYINVSIVEGYYNLLISCFELFEGAKTLVVYTTNVYLINCVMEWINEWVKKETLAQRPYFPQLRTIWEYKMSVNLIMMKKRKEMDKEEIPMGFDKYIANHVNPWNVCLCS